MEELLLRPVLLREELNVVDHQAIQRSIRRFEIVDGVVLQGLDHITDESFAVHVRKSSAAVALFDLIRNRVHEMRLAESHAAVDEQRVVGPPRIAGDLQRRGPGQLIAFSFDEAREIEIRIDGTAEDRRHHAPRTHRGRKVVVIGGDRMRSGGARPHVQHQFGGRPIGKRHHQLLDPRQGILRKPFDDVTIRRQKFQFAVTFNHLQGAHPSIELLLREFALKHTQTAIPKRLRQERSPRVLRWGQSTTGAGSIAPTRQCVY